MKQLYIVAGCNGAGKTTASHTILPNILNCDEFVNADEIARGISPYNAEKVSFQAGRVMLERIKTLVDKGVDFAFETTLSTRTYINLINKSRRNGYEVNLLFFWLSSPELAIKRVRTRVSEGGHDIPEPIIVRRYHRGLKNWFNIFMAKVDNWIFINNSGNPYEIIAEGDNETKTIVNNKVWKQLNSMYYED